MSAFDHPPPWLPPRPAISRPADIALLRPGVFAAAAAFFVPAVAWKAQLPFALSYVATALDSAGGASPRSFASVSLGTDVGGSNKRYTVVVVSMVGASGRTFTGGTIAGVAATLIVASASSLAATAILLADTTGLGTTGTISVAVSGSVDASMIGVYRLINPASATPTASTTTTTVTSNAMTLSTNITSGGAALGVAATQNGGAMSWSGLAGDYSTDMKSSDHGSGAHGGSAGTPAAITATRTTASGAMSGCAASWSP